MKLRDHPLMSYHGLRNWPPVWVTTGNGATGHAVGEIGIVTAVKMYDLSYSRIFLTIEHEQKRYVGCLFFDDRNFCRAVYEILHGFVGFTIEEAGDLDVSCTL